MADERLALTELGELADLRALSHFFDALWQRSTPALPLELLRALTSAGNYTAAAHLDGELVGGLTGFLGRHGDATILHSHILGVAPGVQRRGVGRALKQHQRAWAAQRGIASITWTFDPLVARNARFNLVHLDARPTAFLPDFYGPMADGFNASSPTDRLLVAWPTGPAPASPAVPGGAPAALDIDAHGGPLVREVGGGLRRCRLPADVVGLRRRDPALAAAWSEALRATLGAAMAAGDEVVGLDADDAYVLRPPATAG